MNASDIVSLFIVVAPSSGPKVEALRLAMNCISSTTCVVASFLLPSTATKGNAEVSSDYLVSAKKSGFFRFVVDMSISGLESNS